MNRTLSDQKLNSWEKQKKVKELPNLNSNSEELHQVNDTNANYAGIRIFNSLEGAESANYKEFALRDPLQRLADTTTLIK